MTVFLVLNLIVYRLSVFKLRRREIGYYVLYGVVGVSLYNTLALIAWGIITQSDQALLVSLYCS